MHSSLVCLRLPLAVGTDQNDPSRNDNVGLHGETSRDDGEEHCGAAGSAGLAQDLQQPPPFSPAAGRGPDEEDEAGAHLPQPQGRGCVPVPPAQGRPLVGVQRTLLQLAVALL